MELIIAIVSLGISVVSAGFIYVQVVLAAKTTRSALLNDLVGTVHFDTISRQTLECIYRDALTFTRNASHPLGVITAQSETGPEMQAEVDQLLNRFQMIGHLFFIGALKRIDLRGIRFETIMVGRNRAVREYLRFLNTEFQRLSGVEHDHYLFFKELYLVFEYDKDEKAAFQTCLFRSPRMAASIPSEPT